MYERGANVEKDNQGTVFDYFHILLSFADSCGMGRRFR